VWAPPQLAHLGGEEEQQPAGNKGQSPLIYKEILTQPFAARLIPQYESHIRLTKETIQFVVNLTKEIPHSYRVTKDRTPKLSQQYLTRGP